MLNRRLLTVFAALASLVTALPASAQRAPLPVVVSFSILADITRQLGGDRLTVETLVGPNQDAHTYQPTPADARKAGAARLMIVNGLGFEPTALLRLAETAATKPTVVTASAGVTPLAEPKEDGHGHGHGKAGSDPHAWQQVTAVKTYARNITAALKAADPDGSATYDAALAAYLARLDALDSDIAATIAAIPKERRSFATTHDALRYFGKAYGVEIHALQGISTESEPSAADMARIIRRLKTLKAPAVFLESMTDERKARTIARESGAKVGGTLFTDSLSVANGPAPTYIDMMRHNVREIAKVLTP